MVPYRIVLCYVDKCSRKKVKVYKGAEIQLVPIVGVGIKVGNSIKAFLPIASIELDEFKQLASKHGIDTKSIVGYVSEVKEVQHEERELRLEQP